MAKRNRSISVVVDDLTVEVPRKRTRSTRNGGVSQANKEKYAETSLRREPLKPLNDKQADYIDALRTEPCVICIGVWGSSKTYIPSVIAADLLSDKKIDRIIIARPAEGKGKTIGLLKGTKEDKLEPWCAPITDTIKERVGLSTYEAWVANGRLQLLALEHVKGRSWDNAMIIVDEAEDMDADVAKSLVGRQGINSTLVITGDIRQQDLKSYSGLQYLLDVAEYSGDDITIINFDSWEYCVRSEEAKRWGIRFEKYDNYKKSQIGNSQISKNGNTNKGGVNV